MYFYFVSALQSNDPEWYMALTSVLKNEEAKSLKEVFHLADQRQASLGKDSFYRASQKNKNTKLALSVQWLFTIYPKRPEISDGTKWKD